MSSSPLVHILSTVCYHCAHSYTAPSEVQMVRQSPGAGCHTVNKNMLGTLAEGSQTLLNFGLPRATKTQQKGTHCFGWCLCPDVLNDPVPPMPCPGREPGGKETSESLR